MADTKLQDLTEDATPGGDSLLYTVDDPAGTPADRKTEVRDILAGILTGTGDLPYQSATALTRLGIGIAGQVLTVNSGATAPEWANKPAYVISVAPNATLNPADATTYYFGLNGRGAVATEANVATQIPVTGTLIAVYIIFEQGPNGGTSEAFSVWFRYQKTTDTLITDAATIDGNPNNEFSNTSLSVAVAAGEDWSIKLTTPTWVTDPTTVRTAALLVIRPS